MLGVEYIRNQEQRTTKVSQVWLLKHKKDLDHIKYVRVDLDGTGNSLCSTVFISPLGRSQVQCGK